MHTTALVVLGSAIAVMGALALVPIFAFSVPPWYSIVQIVLGIAAAFIGIIADRRKRI